MSASSEAEEVYYGLRVHIHQDHGEPLPRETASFDELLEIHQSLPHPGTVPEPGACGDPECHVLHADPTRPIHPPDYVDSRTT